MTKLRPSEGRAKVAVGLIFGQKPHCLATFFEILILNLVCPSFTLRLVGNPILKSIGAILAILAHKNLQKTTKMAISRNVIFPKCHSVKGL